MRKTFSLPAVLLLTVAVAAGAQQSGQPTQKPAEKPMAEGTSAAGKPESLEDRAAYSIGLNLGRSLKGVEVNANPDLILQGLRDGLAGEQKLTDEEMQTTMQAFQQQIQEKQEAKQKAIGEKNKTEGEAFLMKNKERPGVKTTASGLQYEVLTEGTGEKPTKPSDTVTVNYKGTLLDGTEFDSSFKHGKPATFVLSQVVSGWTEGVQLMKVGSKYKFYLPSALGWGERGAGGDIGPNAVVVFEVELLSIGQPTPPPALPDHPLQNQGDPSAEPPAEKPPGL